LKFCEKEPTNADKIEKTPSTMLPLDRVLQQQYKAHNSQLIHTLTQTEKRDELLLKNHHKRPISSAPLPEVHNVRKNIRNKNKFHGPDPKNKTGKRKYNRRQRPNSNKRKDNAKSKNGNKCNRCGDFSYFAKNCRAPKRLVALYQKSLKEAKPAGDTRYEAHFNLASEAIQKGGCSNQVPKEQVNNNSLNIEENRLSIDNMLLDFGSGDR
jgi:hypothetical protein